ncbi:MAG: hypothetical protein CFE43_12315 [Burkholderiales bacterium PBB3]|nr:MAG: hypothetical protein CFE43_12315 [Burkholderiales bacterium PBB3]
MPLLRNYFTPTSPTLARRILWQIGAVIALVIMAVTWLSYRNTADTLRLEAVDNLGASVKASATYESVDFQIAEANTQALRDEYLARLKAMGTRDPVAEFDAWFVRYPDGLIRMRPERDDHKHLPSIYIREKVQITAEVRRRVVAAFQMLREWGPSLTLRYFSAYIDLPGQSLIMYSPGVNWGREADASTNNYDYPPVQNSAPDKNPTRKSQWTGVYFDDKAQTWMVSTITPVDQVDWVGTASQDIALDALIARTQERAAPGTYNLILDAQGRLLAHPLLMAAIRKAGGNLDIGTLSDPLLTDIAAQARRVGTTTEVLPSSDQDHYLGISRIQGPQWYWVTVYPKALVEQRSIAAARSILLAGLVGLVVELALLAWILHRQVALPLTQLSAATQALAQGQRAVQLDMKGQAELGQLARNFQHMTEQLREREEGLIRSVAFRDTLFQTIPDLVFVKDLEGRYLSANRAFALAYGATESQLLGVRDCDLVPQADADYYAMRDLEALNAGRPVHTEHDSVNVITGLRSYYETVKTPIFDPSGKCVGLLGIGRNITERKMAERALQALNDSLEDRVQRRTQALETANAEMAEAMRALQNTQRELIEGEKLASLGRMVAGIAHELNTPIGNALMIGSTLADQARQMDKAMLEDRLKRSELADFLREAAAGSVVLERALRQASHLIASFKQVAADQQSEQRRPFDLATNVDEILAILRPGLRGPAITLESAVPLDIAMDSYPGLLAQVISNLVTNAKMHAFDGTQEGSVRVEAIDLGETVRLAIRDDGKGIPEDIRARIFEPFFTTRMGRGGTGLGLSIVHGLVTQGLGGQIAVDYGQAQGTGFLITLPKSDPRPPRHAELDSELTKLSA